MMMTLDCPQITGKLQVKKNKTQHGDSSHHYGFAVSKMRISKNNNTENIKIKKFLKKQQQIFMNRLLVLISKANKQTHKILASRPPASTG